MLITKGKTNIGYLFVTVALAVFASGIIIGASKMTEQFYQHSSFQQIQSVKDETADWNVYSDSEVNFTFKYPKDWEVKDDYFYETAAGIKSENRTIVLQKIEGEESNDSISINQRQFQCDFGKCLSFVGGVVQTYSKKPEILDILDEIANSSRSNEIINTAGWQTYTNNQYGFEIKYPETFLMRENNEKFQSCFLSYEPYQCSNIKNGIFSVDFKNKEGNFSIYCGAVPTETKNVMVVQISLIENNNNLTMNDLTKNCENASSGNTSREDCFFYDKKVDGQKAVDVRINGIGGNLPAIYIAKGDKIYLISLVYSCDTDYHASEYIFNQMLSTFKFIE